MSLSMICQSIKEIILLGVSVGMLYVALEGLHVWKRQLVGKDEYDLAKKLMFNFYQYREAMSMVRHPAVWAFEYPKDEGQELQWQDSSVRHKGLIHAYGKRWEKLGEIKALILTAILESQVLWGDDLRKICDKIFKLEHEIYVEISFYLQKMDPEQKIEDKCDLKKIYDSQDENKDYFRLKFAPLLKEVEDYLLPKIRNFYKGRKDWQSWTINRR